MISHPMHLVFKSVNTIPNGPSSNPNPNWLVTSIVLFCVDLLRNMEKGPGFNVFAVCVCARVSECRHPSRAPTNNNKTGCVSAGPALQFAIKVSTVAEATCGTGVMWAMEVMGRRHDRTPCTDRMP